MSVIDGLGYGGAERSLAELLPGLAERGIEPTVACLRRRRGGVEGDVLAQGFDVRFLPGGSLARVAALRGIIRETSADLVHTSLVESSLVGRWAAAGTGVPVLTSLVNQSYSAARRADPHVNRLAAAAVRLLDHWTARHLTTHFHAITHAVKRWAVSELGVPAERVTVVERGRDPRRLGEPGAARRLEARAKLGLAPDVPVIVAVGRQEFQKGHRFLLDAMDVVLRAHPDAVLLIAGREGAETGTLRRRASSFGPAVRFLGHRDDLPDVLVASDVFAFPSQWEGLGGAVIEAMALGLPIVASDLAPVREVVEDGRCAVLVPPGTPEAIGSSIVSVLADPERARTLGLEGRRIFASRFTLQRSTERMARLCWDLSGSAQARSVADGLEVV